MVKLIYRGHSLERTLHVQPYQKPHALNWRYHAPGETYGSAPRVLHDRTPGVVNWRFRPQGEV